MKTIKEAIGVYLDHCQVMQFTEATVTSYRDRLDTFLNWCESQQIATYEEISKAELYGYQSYLSSCTKRDGQPLSFNSQESFLATVKSLFNWLMEQNYIDVSPVMFMTSPKRPKRLSNRGLTREEIKTLFNDQNTNTIKGIRNRCMLELLYCTAMRASEMANLQLDHIDHALKVITIIEGKGKKDGLALYGTSAEYWLKKYLEESRPHLANDNSPENLFLTRSGNAYQKGGIGIAVKAMMRKAGIENQGAAHLLRHSFAVHMLERGMDSCYISEFLRHEEVNTTKTYLGVDVRMLRKEFDERF